AIEVLKKTLAGLPNLPKELIDDVQIGCATPEAEQGLNVARVIGLGAGLPVSSSAVTVNRFCSSGLQTIANIAERIMIGAIDAGSGGGVESMSMIPMGGHNALPSPALDGPMPELYISMGLTAENVAKKYEISRADQDAFALESHNRALAAIAGGKFKDEIIPVTLAEGGVFDTDEGPRAGSTLEALGGLRPVFHVKGSVTAGNSSQTSDGAAMTVLTSADKAKALGLTPLARFVGF